MVSVVVSVVVSIPERGEPASREEEVRESIHELCRLPRESQSGQGGNLVLVSALFLQPNSHPTSHPSLCPIKNVQVGWGGGGFRGPTGNAIPHSLTDLGATALQRDELGDLATVVPGIRRACEHVSGWVGELTNIRFFGEGGEGKKREGIYSI